MFPIPDRGGGGLQLVQDELRSVIMPLFIFDPLEPLGRPIGHGTTFRIDPWSRCMTAFHVIEQLLVLGRGQSVEVRPDLRLTALELEGIVLGRVRLPQDAWRPIAQAFGPAAIDAPIVGSRGLRNISELAVLAIPPSAPSEGGTPYLRVDLQSWRPTRGERVVALGYPNLDRPPTGSDDSRPIHQYLYGAFGEIIDIEPADPNRVRPWPLIRVSQEWPGGMSGGPVFNEAGNVIGVVSSGVGDVGSATFLSGWRLPVQMLRELDPINPGWFLVHGAFDSSGALRQVERTAGRIEAYARQHGLPETAAISFNPENCSHIRVGTRQ